MQYRTVQNDMLDHICWRYYDRTDVIFEVLNANPGLCEQPEKLPSGLIIELPDLPQLPSQMINIPLQ